MQLKASLGPGPRIPGGSTPGPGTRPLPPRAAPLRACHARPPSPAAAAAGRTPLCSQQQLRQAPTSTSMSMCMCSASTCAFARPLVPAAHWPRQSPGRWQERTTAGAWRVLARALPPDSESPRPHGHAQGQQPRHREHWEILSEEGGDALSPAARKPSPLLTAHEAVVAQLEALRTVYHPNGDIPLPDTGLEVLYNFASIDPFNKGSSYFGETLNVAYFSQFSAKFSLRQFRALLGMQSYEIISSLHLSQSRFIARVGVCAAQDSLPAVFLFNMVKKESGHLKGCWVTQSLQRVDLH